MALRRQRLLVAALLLGQLVARGGYAQQPSPPAIANSPFLQHMPVNSRRRCVGVCAVSQALLQARFRRPDETSGTAPVDAATLARNIYAGLVDGEPEECPSMVRIDGELHAIDSPEVLNRLSTLVTDLYRKDYDCVTASPVHAHQLALAQRQFISDQAALKQLLERDRDRTLMFIGTGQRSFPDGRIRPTYHAFLLTLDDDGQIMVFDPNAPGRPWKPTLRDTPGGLTVAWSAPYRKTEQTTQQQYRIVGQQQYFHTLFASVRQLCGTAGRVSP